MHVAKRASKEVKGEGWKEEREDEIYVIIFLSQKIKEIIFKKKLLIHTITWLWIKDIKLL